MTHWALGLQLLHPDTETPSSRVGQAQRGKVKGNPKHTYTAPLSIMLIVVFGKLGVKGPISSSEVRLMYPDALKYWNQEQTHRCMAKMSLGPNPFFIKIENPFYAKGKNSRFIFERNPLYKRNEHTQELVEKVKL